MKKMVKKILIFPFYIILLLFGFVGGTDDHSNTWEELVKWSQKD